MSRTWRKVPKSAHYSSRQAWPQRPRGALASNGPSAERYRPDRHLDPEVLQLATDLLAHTAQTFTSNQAALASLTSTGESPGTLQLLCYAVADTDCPCELVHLVIDMARQAIVAINDPDAGPSPELFTAGARHLTDLVNAELTPPPMPRHVHLVPDGRQMYSRLPIWRDSRVTGLRAEDHRRARREARRGLVEPNDAESIRAGKSRRYTDRHGDYYY